MNQDLTKRKLTSVFITGVLIYSRPVILLLLLILFGTAGLASADLIPNHEIEVYESNYHGSWFPENTISDNLGGGDLWAGKDDIQIGEVEWLVYKFSGPINLSQIYFYLPKFYSSPIDDYLYYFMGELEIQISQKADPNPNSDADWITIHQVSGDFEPDKAFFTVLVDDITTSWVRLRMEYQGRGAWGSTPEFFLNEIDFHGTFTSTRPEVADTKFSVGRGFYDAPFDVDISTATPGATIVYTLDGSDPKNNYRSSFSGTTPVRVPIDPESLNTPGVILRAYAYRDGYAPTNVDTQTYLFLDKVTPSFSPDGVPPGDIWPDEYANIWPLEQQSIDYGIDPDVYDNVTPEDWDMAMTQVQTISMVTDFPNLFDSETGIYMNASEHGREWERPVSIEILDDNDPSNNVQVDAGMRTKGGFSRSDFNPKHGFRFFFRSEYGDGMFDYPLFGDEGVERFNKIDLRTSQGLSWNAFGSPLNKLNTMNRDVFSRDTQRDMGQPYARSRYYHLYINGYYWGLFQTLERTDAGFGVSYLNEPGDDYDRDDYDVVKIDTEVENYDYVIKATDGNLDAWEEIWNMCLEGFSSDINYYKLEGKGPDGQRDPGLKVLVDIDNLIDYMIIIFYTGNIDAPVTKYLGGNKIPNNFFAVYNRNNEDKGFVFFAIDSELTLIVDPVFENHMGLLENRVNIGRLTDEYWRMEVNSFDKFHPQWLHFKLSENAKYRKRFSERVKMHMTKNGAITKQKCVDRFMARANEIDYAIIMESARWGDARSEIPRTKADWQKAVDDIVNLFFLGTGPLGTRTMIVLKQLDREKLYRLTRDLSSILLLLLEE